MGSPLRLTLGCGAVSPERARRAWDGVVDSFEASEAAMSRFRETSELTVFNRRAGRSISGRPSRRLRQALVAGRPRRALVAADRARRIPAGRFDPTVVADLDRLGYRGASVPSVPAQNDGRVI